MEASHFVVSKELMIQLLSYLHMQRYADVAPLVNALHQCPSGSIDANPGTDS